MPVNLTDVLEGEDSVTVKTLASEEITSRFGSGHTDIMRGDTITSFKNKLINGGFDIWQRGTSFTESNGFTADRWRVNKLGATCTVSENLYADKTYIAIYENNGGYHLTQTIEHGIKFMQNKTYTVSVRTLFDNTKTVDVEMRYYDSTDALVHQVVVGTLAITDEVDKITTLTFTMPDYTYSNTYGAYVRFGIVDRSASTGTHRYYNIQIEEGSVATPFEQRPIGHELSLCQRYYEAGGIVSVVAGKSGAASTAYKKTVYYKVDKRVSPTVIFGTISYFNGNTIEALADNNTKSGFDIKTVCSVDEFVNSRLNSWTSDAEL